MTPLLENEIFGLATLKQVVVILHLFGLALGAGGAFFSDFLFTHILKDKKIDESEFKILNLLSSVIWIGLAVLFFTGLTLFFSDTERYLDSTKFLSKMTIIFVLFINGLMFHFSHIPKLSKLVNVDLSKSKEFREISIPFFVGGAVSGVSWAAAVVLGSLSYVDLSYWAIMAIYILVLVIFAVPMALKLRKKMIG